MRTPSETLSLLADQARRKQYKSGWVAHMYRRIYGAWPTRNWRTNSIRGYVSDSYSRFTPHDDTAQAVNDYWLDDSSNVHLERDVDEIDEEQCDLLEMNVAEKDAKVAARAVTVRFLWGAVIFLLLFILFMCDI